MEIEETDDLLENEYLNDGFDDVDCDVDDLMKTKGRISTGSKAKTVDEEEMAVQAALKKKQKQHEEQESNEKKEEEPLLDYSDFFADDNTSTDGGEAVMQLKSVPVMKPRSSEDPDSLIFPLPQSERRAVSSPLADDYMRESRSSQDMQRAPVSPITVETNSKPKVYMSKALSNKIAAKQKKDDDNSLPSIHKKPHKKASNVRIRAPQSLDEKSVASEREAAREQRLPHINRAEKKKKVVPLKSKRNKAEIAQAREKYLKGKRDRATADPVSPRINFKYDARLGLFGFDEEAERQSKRENYALMRKAKMEEQQMEIARARVRAQVVHGAGMMDAQTILPGGFGQLQFPNNGKPKKERVKRQQHNNHGQPVRDRNQLRSKSDFQPDPHVEEHKVRSISSENNKKISKIKNKHVQRPHFEDEILSKYQHNNLDAMQCSPIVTDGVRKKKKSVQMNPDDVIISTQVASGDDFYEDDEQVMGEVSESHGDAGTVGAAKKMKTKVSPLKLSAIKKQRDKANPPYTNEAHSPSPRRDQPYTPTTGDRKNSFQRKSQNRKDAGSSSSPRRRKKIAGTPRKKASPRRRAQDSSLSPGKHKQKTKFDIDVFDSVSKKDDPDSESKPKPKPKPPSINSPGKNLKNQKGNNKNKKSLVDELFEDFDDMGVNTSPPSKLELVDEDSAQKQPTTPKKKSPRSVDKKASGGAIKEDTIGQPPKNNGSSSPRKAMKKTSSSPSPSPRKKNKKKTKRKSNSTVKEEKNDGDDDFDYDLYDEDFDDDEGGGANDDVKDDDDVLFDFSPEVHESSADKKEAARIQAEMEAAEAKEKEFALAKKKKEEEAAAAAAEQLARQKAEEEKEAMRIKLEEEKKVAMAKEEKRKARALARAQEEEAEREAQKKKREEAAEAKRQAELKAQKEQEEAERIRAEKEQREREEEEERQRVAAEAKRRQEEEEARLAAAAAAKEEEDERARILAQAASKEDKLEKASKSEIQIDDKESKPVVVASPKEKKEEEVEDEYAEDEYDDYNFDDEDMQEEGQRQSGTEQDSSSTTGAGAGGGSTIQSPVRQSPPKSSTESQNPVDEKSDHENVLEEDLMAHGDHDVSKSRDKRDEDGDDDDDVLFDFNKPSPSPNKSPNVNKSASPSEEKEKEKKEDENEDEYEDDYDFDDEDFD